MDAVLAIIKKGAGTDFNPLLVDNFISAFMKVTQKEDNRGIVESTYEDGAVQLRPFFTAPAQGKNRTALR